MMLWLLATLSVVTMSWGMAHRLKALQRLIARASDARVAATTARDVRTAACTETEGRFANPRTGTLLREPQKPEPNTSTSGEE